MLSTAWHHTIAQEHQALQQELTHAQERAADLARRLEAAEASTSQLHAAQSRIAELEGQLDTAQLRRQDDAEDGALQAANARVHALEAQLASAHEAATTAQRDLQASATSTAAQLQAQLDALQGTGTEVDALHARADAADSALASHIDKWTRLLEDKDAEVAAQVAAAGELKSRLEEAERKAHEAAAAAEARVQAAMRDAEVCYMTRCLCEDCTPMQATASRLEETTARESELAQQLADITERSSQLGELPVLRSALDAAKSDMASLRKEHEAERDKVKKAIQEMKRKLDRAVKDKQRAEAAAAEARTEAGEAGGAARAEASELRAQLTAREGAVQQVEAELKEYKVRVWWCVDQQRRAPQARASALLAAKERDLRTARESQQAQRAAELGDLQTRLAEAEGAREEAVRALQDATERWEVERADTALQLDSQLRGLQEEVQTLQDTAESYRRYGRCFVPHGLPPHKCVLPLHHHPCRSAEQWKRKHEALSAEHAALKRPMEELRTAHAAAQAEAAAAVASLAALRQEHDAFKETSLRLAEAKDAEVARLLELHALVRTEPGPRRSGSFADEGRLSTPFDLPHVEHVEEGSVVDRRSVGPAASDLGDLDDGRTLQAAERQVRAVAVVRRVTVDSRRWWTSSLPTRCSACGGWSWRWQSWRRSVSCTSSRSGRSRRHCGTWSGNGNVKR